MLERSFYIVDNVKSQLFSPFSPSSLQVRLAVSSSLVLKRSPLTSLSQSSTPEITGAQVILLLETFLLAVRTPARGGVKLLLCTGAAACLVLKVLSLLPGMIRARVHVRLCQPFRPPVVFEVRDVLSGS